MRRFSSKVAAPLVGLMCMLGTSPAAGQDGDEVLLQRGLAARREGRDADALVLFQQAYALRATPRARAQVALAEQALGQWLAAERDLRAVLASDDAWIVRYRRPLETALAFVSTHLGWVTVRCDVPGARAVLDGVPLAVVPTEAPVRVVAGDMRLRVEAEGHLPIERSIHVDAERRDDEVVVLPPAPQQPRNDAAEAVRPAGLFSPAVPTPGPGRDGNTWSLGVTLAGVAAVGAEVGTAFGVDVLRTKSERDAHCSGVRCDPQGLELDARARTEAIACDVSFGVAAAALATSVVLLWRPAHGARQVGVAPLLAPSTAGLSVSEVW